MNSPVSEIKAAEPKLVVVSKKAEATESHVNWKYFGPVLVAAALAFAPAPAGLPQHAWYYFALFAGVIVGLMLEPLPGGAIGLIGLTLATALAPWVLYGPAELAKAGFNPTTAALTWAHNAASGEVRRNAQRSSPQSCVLARSTCSSIRCLTT